MASVHLHAAFGGGGTFRSSLKKWPPPARLVPLLPLGFMPRPSTLSSGSLPAPPPLTCHLLPSGGLPGYTALCMPGIRQHAHKVHDSVPTFAAGTAEAPDFLGRHGTHDSRDGV